MRKRSGERCAVDEGELIAVLSTLIESYEINHIPRRKPTPAETPAHWSRPSK